MTDRTAVRALGTSTSRKIAWRPKPNSSDGMCTAARTPSSMCSALPRSIDIRIGVEHSEAEDFVTTDSSSQRGRALQDRRSRSLSLLIDQVQKLSRGFSITKGTMMLFQVDLIDLAKVAKAVGFVACGASSCSRRGGGFASFWRRGRDSPLRSMDLENCNENSVSGQPRRVVCTASVRRLERIYGKEKIKSDYDLIAGGLRPAIALHLRSPLLYKPGGRPIPTVSLPAR
jgi:hypothetical protein